MTRRPKSSERQIRTDGDVGSVLGLAQQVGGDELDVGLVVGDHRDLAGSGQQVDADATEQLALGLGYVGIARADEHVDRRFALEPERHRGDGLDAAERVDRVGPAEVGGVEHRRVAGSAALRRRGGQDPLDARDLGHEHGHEGTRHQRAVAGGQVGANAADGHVAVADEQAGSEFALDVAHAAELQLGKALHALVAELKTLADAGVDSVPRAVELVARHREPFRAPAVELLRMAADRVHAVALDLEQHRRHALDDLRIGELAAGGQTGLQVVGVAGQWKRISHFTSKVQHKMFQSRKPSGMLAP